MSQPEPGTDLQPAERLITMFVTNGVAVSSGEQTPGVVHVPPAEAADLAHMRYAVYGEKPPDGYSGDALRLLRAFTRYPPGTPRAGLRGG